MKKVIALFLALVMLVSFAACGEEYKLKEDADFKVWFNEALVPAYEGYINSDTANENAFPSISLMLASDAYIGYIFDYICNDVYPENGEITEENGVYNYSYNEFRQSFEFNADKRALKVTMYMEMMGDSRKEFVAVFAEKKGEFYIQYLMPTFSEYTEMCFTAQGGTYSLDVDRNEMPFDIFTDDIPDNFAKEN
ncbi:MAG: hypothetical protein IJN38_07360 [Clostridia bacterium]|nr:hypothetical protein [Clostridia bacterium]